VVRVERAFRKKGETKEGESGRNEIKGKARKWFWSFGKFDDPGSWG